jgi:hypothetical protein
VGEVLCRHQATPLTIQTLNSLFRRRSLLLSKRGFKKNLQTNKKYGSL